LIVLLNERSDNRFTILGTPIAVLGALAKSLIDHLSVSIQIKQFNHSFQIDGREAVSFDERTESYFTSRRM
jgi:hypothetical protein